MINQSSPQPKHNPSPTPKQKPIITITQDPKSLNIHNTIHQGDNRQQGDLAKNLRNYFLKKMAKDREGEKKNSLEQFFPISVP